MGDMKQFPTRGTLEQQIEADKTAGFKQPASTQPASLIPVSGKALDLLEALIFSSSSGGHSHIVTIHTDAVGGRSVRCTCKAMLSIETRPSGCWAMKAARVVIGIPSVG